MKKRDGKRFGRVLLRYVLESEERRCLDVFNKTHGQVVEVGRQERKLFGVGRSRAYALASSLASICALVSPSPMPDLRPLPPQLIGPVARYADRSALPALARVSRIFHLETVRVLYRKVFVRGRTETSAFNRRICEQDSLARLVVALDVHVESLLDGMGLHRLALLRHLALTINPVLLEQLAVFQSDALDSLTLRSRRFEPTLPITRVL